MQIGRVLQLVSPSTLAGKIALWCPNINYPLSKEPESSLLAQSTPSEVESLEISLRKLLKATLIPLGLQIPEREGKGMLVLFPNSPHPLQQSPISYLVYKVARRLVLRTPRLSDTSSCTALFSNPPNFAYELVKASDSPRNINGCEEHIKAFIASANKGEHAQLVFVIPTDPTAPLLDENNKPIQHPVIGMGGINYLFIKNGLKYALVGFVIDSKGTRKGYGTEVLTVVVLVWRSGSMIVQLEIMAVNGPFDSFMKKNFGEFKGVERDGPYGREKVWETWRAEWELKAKKASK